MVFIHKINFEYEPLSLNELYNYNMKSNSRFIRCPSETKYKATSAKVRDALIDKSLLVYKKIQNELKSLNIDK